jgi:hypothetical protein
MNFKKQYLIAAAGAFLSQASLFASDQAAPATASPAAAGFSSRFFVGGPGLQAGTLGLGITGNVKVPFVNLRLNVNYLPDITRNYKGKSADAQGSRMRWGGATVGFLADFHPFKSFYHITAGVYWNRMKMNMETTVQGEAPVLVGGMNVQVPVKSDVKSSARFRPWAPYLGVGINWRPDSLKDCSHHGTGVHMGFDVGILFQGKTTVKVDQKGYLTDAQVTDFETAKAKSLNDRWWMKAYPVISLKVKYKF